MRHREAGLHAKLVRVARLSLREALDLWRIQRIEFVLVFRLLRADTFGACHHDLQPMQAQRAHKPPKGHQINGADIYRDRGGTPQTHEPIELHF